MTEQNVERSPVGKRIFVVDDDVFFRESLAQNFSAAGFLVNTAGDGEGALDKLSSDTADHKPDLVILDWKMPGLTGIEVLQKAREVGVRTPMILLTTLTDPIYEESALESGAVDFVEKSRSFSILLKRVELILSGTHRKTGKSQGDGEILTVGPLELRSESHRAIWTGKEIPLTLSEFDIVKLMASRSGTDVSFKEIHHLIHGEGFVLGFGPEGYRANVRTYIKRIRKKFRDIDEQFDSIKNYPGFGYSWRQP